MRPLSRCLGVAALPLIPTTLVGSYPQPDWLIDRERLLSNLPAARARAGSCGACRSRYLAEAQDDATALAIRDLERVGLDILTDGEIRRESYSNRFATALEGMDIDNPAMVAGRTGRHEPRAARRRPDPAHAARRGRRPALPAREHGPADQDHPARPVHHEPAGAERGTTPTTPSLALDLAAAVNEEIRDLFAAGADVVQIDEPWLQARPERGPRVRGRRRSTARWRASRARPPCTPASATPTSCTDRPAGLLLPRRAQRLRRRPDRDRVRAAEARPLDPRASIRDKTMILGVLDLSRPRAGDGGRGRRAASRRRSSSVAARAPAGGARLRHEVPAARRRVREARGARRRRPQGPARSCGFEDRPLAEARRPRPGRSGSPLRENEVEQIEAYLARRPQGHVATKYACPTWLSRTPARNSTPAHRAGASAARRSPSPIRAR